jgi:chromosomal replication initiator protein
MSANPTEKAQATSEKPGATLTELNPRYTFENFTVGTSNQVAHAVSRQVAENLGQLYNSLFLAGGYGLGKTHLLQAIGNAALQMNPNLTVRYVTAERFTNELIESIKQTKVLVFRQKYRNADLFLLDNLEYLAGKEQTQDELLYTLESLMQENRQVVIASDRLPGATPFLSEHLLSRLHSGVVVNISAPDEALRLAFLQAKAANQPVSPEVLALIAQKVSGSISKLEGALNSLLAYARHSNTELTVEVAGQLLDSMLFSSIYLLKS